MSSLSSNGIAAQLEDVHKDYHMGSQVVKALAGITISFQTGSFWAILGPSGSGKSTLLNLLGCLDRPSKGRYLLSGHDVSTLDDDRLSDMRLRHLGFIFQSFNLLPQSTVEENIQLPLYYLGWNAADSAERARDLARKVGLEERLRHRPMELSGGQQQRVAIARALANNPSILLADEPTGNLDSATGKEIMGMLIDLNRQGKTIIMVTHERTLAEYASHRLYMKDGMIERIEGGDSSC
ncbi:MAG TPA: ABC transporter ATP-binding protein [bacterium]|nr:ABC transporter ATP-binding protein [bacterium]HQL62756.1 ABC transporter ATP-binding protein [bacterium]